MTSEKKSSLDYSDDIIIYVLNNCITVLYNRLNYINISFFNITVILNLIILNFIQRKLNKSSV